MKLSVDFIYTFRRNLSHLLPEINRKYLLKSLTYSFLWLILIFGAFKAAHISSTEKIIKSLESQLKVNTNYDNYDQLIRYLSQIESFQIVRCIEVTALPPNSPPLQIMHPISLCDTGINKLSLLSEEHSIKITTANSTEWILSFFVSPAIELYYLIWSLIGLAVASTFSFFAYQKKVDHQKIASLYQNFLTRDLLYNEARKYAHDIRSPMSAFQTVSSLLKNDNPNYSLLLNQASEKIQFLTNDFLNYVKAPQKIVSSKTLLAGEEVERLVKQEIDQKQLEPITQSKNINFDFESHLNSELVFIMHPSLFSRLISNVLNNAVEASESGSTVFVKTKLKENFVLITITNFGKPIPQEILKAIGKSFVTTKKNGNGFGLYDASQAMLAVGGNLNCKNIEGGVSIVLEFQKSII